MESQFLNDMKLMQAHTIHEVSYGRGHVSWHEYGDAKTEGMPLILLHGGHGSWEHWHHNVEELSEHFHVFVPDMPGFGNSSFFDSQLQAGMISPLVVTINDLIGKDKQIQIAGFSFGGFVAAHLANQRLGVTKLALLGSLVMVVHDVHVESCWHGRSFMPAVISKSCSELCVRICICKC